MTDLITNSIYHRSIDGTELVRLREVKGLSQAELSRRCGCSQTYICQLERPGLWEIRVGFADKIQEILA